MTYLVQVAVSVLLAALWALTADSFSVPLIHQAWNESAGVLVVVAAGMCVYFAPPGLRRWKIFIVTLLLPIILWAVSGPLLALAGTGVCVAAAMGSYLKRESLGHIGSWTGFCVSFPAGVLFLLFEPRMYGMLQEWGMNGLLDQAQLVAFVPTFAVLVVQLMLAFSQEDRTFAA